MDPSRFADTEFGRATRTPGDRWAFTYYLPAAVPRELPLDGETIYALSKADAALGNLNGLGRLITQPELLIQPYVAREAVASSRIEGTQTSLSEVLQAEAGGDARTRDADDVREVERYIAATRQGLDLLESLPISQRLIKQLHRTLLDGVRGQEKLPGEFRTSPVWIGSPSDSPETAVYVPPLPEHLGALLADWERYVNEPSRQPVLVRCALMHYQFETIHPFLDGNGRIGRLLITLMLIEAGRLDLPLLYVSGYLEAHRREYYDRLQEVRETGDIQGWLQFFLTAVQKQAEDAVDRAGRLVGLRSTYQDASRLSRSRIGSVVDLMFVNPYLTVARVARAVGVTDQGARNLIKDAESRGWVSLIGRRNGRLYWVADEILDIIEPGAEPHGRPTAGGGAG